MKEIEVTVSRLYRLNNACDRDLMRKITPEHKVALKELKSALLRLKGIVYKDIHDQRAEGE